jgi:hypothetical protein
MADEIGVGVIDEAADGFLADEPGPHIDYAQCHRIPPG